MSKPILPLVLLNTVLLSACGGGGGSGAEAGPGQSPAPGVAGALGRTPSSVSDVNTVGVVTLGGGPAGGLYVLGEFSHLDPAQSEATLLDLVEQVALLGPDQGCGYFVDDTGYGSYADRQLTPASFSTSRSASIGGPVIVTSSAGTLLESGGTDGDTYGFLNTDASYVNQNLIVSIPAGDVAAFEISTPAATLPSDLRIEDETGQTSNRANIHSTIRWTPDSGGEVWLEFGYSDIDGGSAVEEIICKVPNTGQFTFPEEIKSHIGEVFSAEVELTRLRSGIVRSGDSLLVWRRISNLRTD